LIAVRALEPEKWSEQCWEQTEDKSYKLERNLKFEPIFIELNLMSG
jgi:hypothetical protein